MTMSWEEALRRIRAGEDVQAVLDQRLADERDEFVAWLREEAGDEAAERHLVKVRDIDTGVYGARMCWQSISYAQRRALSDAHKHGGRFDRVGKQYRDRDRNQPYKPVYVSTVRSLCARELMAWDGGALDPEAAAVVTERGRFVLEHGASKASTTPP